MHKIGFNKEYAQSIPKEQWVKEHKHLECDLSAEYDKLNPPKQVKPKAPEGDKEAS